MQVEKVIEVNSDDEGTIDLVSSEGEDDSPLPLPVVHHEQLGNHHVTETDQVAVAETAINGGTVVNTADATVAAIVAATIAFVHQPPSEAAVAAQRAASGKPYVCEFCEKRFTSKCQLKIHIRLHNGERPYRCHQCTKAFTSYRFLNAHIKTHKNQRPFQCSQCPSAFTAKQNLKAHTNIHTNERPFWCTTCNKSFLCKSSFQLHLRRFFHPTFNPPPQPNNTTPQLPSAHYPSPPPRCDSPSPNIATAVNLNEQLGNHHVTKTDQVAVAKIAINGSTAVNTADADADAVVTATAALVHQPLSESAADYQGAFPGNVHRLQERPYHCTVCSKAFKTPGVLRDHAKMHTGERPYVCVFCEKRFIYKSQLKTHIRYHTGERPYQCSQCSLAFFLKGSLNVHIKTHTNERPYQCSQCLLAFTTKQNLKSHTYIHTNERLFWCTTCIKPFRCKRSLQLHLCRVHPSSNHPLQPNYTTPQSPSAHYPSPPFRRDSPSPNIATAVNLNEQFGNHQATKTDQVAVAETSIDGGTAVNTADADADAVVTATAALVHQPPSEAAVAAQRAASGKPYVCEFCEKRFIYKYDLKVHIRLHTGERPYQCHQCTKAFNNYSNLSAHIRTHTGERPFWCKQCPKRFKHNKDLIIHTRRHTGEQPFRCTVCNSSYIRKDALLNHLRHDHPSPNLPPQPNNTTPQSPSVLYFFPSPRRDLPLPNIATAVNLNEQIVPQNATTDDPHHHHHPVKIEQLGNHHATETDQVAVAETAINGGTAVNTADADVAAPAAATAAPVHQPPSETAKAFTNWSNLNEHMQTHTGEWPFQSKQCPKRFVQHSALKRHLCTHTGKRLFQCRECPVVFFSSNNLQHHLCYAHPFFNPPPQPNQSQ